MFNLKRAQSNPQPLDKHLSDNREGSGLDSLDVSGSTEWQLSQDKKPGQRHRDEVASESTEKQLSSKHSGNSGKSIEGALNQDKKVYNEKRFPKSYETTMSHPANRVAEGHDQKRREEFLKAQKAAKRDTEFWDKGVGEQKIGEPTKIVRRNPDSQLSNAIDKHKGMQSTQPINEDRKKNEKAMGKKDPCIDKSASIKDADALLFHIYAQAAKAGRDVNELEKQMIIDINSSKVRHFAQFGGEEYADPQFFGGDENLDGYQSPGLNGDVGGMDSEDRFTIEPGPEGFTVVDNEIGDVIDSYPTLQEAEQARSEMIQGLTAEESDPDDLLSPENDNSYEIEEDIDQNGDIYAPEDDIDPPFDYSQENPEDNNFGGVY